MHYAEPSYGDALELVTQLVTAGLKKTAIYYREDQPCGLLILVPFQEGSPPQKVGPLNWNGIARDACRACDLRFVDYSDHRDDNRRRGYAGDEVRISTFHSAKGIEGLHVIVLGFDCLAEAAPRTVNRGVNNLGYIVLSRSQYDTDVVCVKRDFSRRQEAEFLEEVIQVVGN
jgi:hypothetical protein